MGNYENMNIGLLALSNYWYSKLGSVNSVTGEWICDWIYKSVLKNEMTMSLSWLWLWSLEEKKIASLTKSIK